MDFYISENGEVDMSKVCIHEDRTRYQLLFCKLKTNKGDWFANEPFGCSLEQYIGVFANNIPSVINSIISDVCEIGVLNKSEIFMEPYGSVEKGINVYLKSTHKDNIYKKSRVAFDCFLGG